MRLHFVAGDATEFTAGDTKHKMLVHCVNCLGVMGSGIAKTVKEKWPKVYYTYKEIACPKRLGYAQVVYTDIENRWVCNLFGQNNTGAELVGDVTIIPFDYRAFRIGLAILKRWLGKQTENCSLHMPRIGCGLALAEWDKVEAEIKDVFNNVDIDIYVYDYVPPQEK